ncbi:MAG TPA: GNAT family N-acetyltransferase [Vicinamibacterales bacterium]|nr:GNAT family N-acetyltransferase [Vicinamibacterales bacterium]
MIRLDVCGPNDFDELVAMLAEVFTTADPPAVAVGLTPDEFAALVDLYRTRVVEDGLTVIARAVDSGAIAGALLSEDSAAAFPDGVERLSPKFEPIFDILSQLDADHRVGRRVLRGDSLHLFLLGVREPYTRRGLAQRLVAESLALGRRRGYRAAVTEATNLVSQHVFRKLDFVERVRRSYKDYRLRGEAIFGNIAAHGGPVLFDRTLV